MEGLAEGLAKGKAEGLAEGVLEGKRQLVVTMKQNGVLPAIISQYTGLSISEIEQL